jgi:hypothetical protein
VRKVEDKNLGKHLKVVKNFCEEVPTATEWTTHIHKKSLTSTHLHEIIKRAVAPLTNLADSSSVEMPHILTMAVGALSLAGELECKHATAVARLVGYVLLRMSKGVEGVKEHKFNKYSKDWQRRYRRFVSWVYWMMVELKGWKGREIQLYLILGKN